MPSKTKCVYENCGKILEGKPPKLCREHYLLSTKDKKYTLGTKHGRPKNTGKCKVDSCKENNYSMGYCRPHYEKNKKYGDPLIIKRQNNPDHCNFLGCNDICHAMGFCQKHYWRNQRYGSPYITHKQSEHEDHCNIEGCNELYYAKSYCRYHYSIYEYGRTGNH